jgi:hypothetical protein
VKRWTVLPVTLLATMVAVGEARAQQPLGEQTRRKIFWSSPEDPEPKKRRLNAHFWAGNERELYIFYRDLKGLGGGYLGVGSDQCYLLLGWMRARYAWCVDYDAKVVLVHLIHQAFFHAAPTPKAFLSLWGRRHRKRAARVLEKTYARDPRRKAILQAFRKSRASVFTRLYRMSIFMKRALTPSYLSTQSQYDFVRKRVVARRVRPMLGNLLGDRALRSIGRAARRLSVVIRALYLSNAEQYWRRYSADYRKNIQALPFDKRSWVLRTFGKSKKTNLYTYQRQSASGYLAYLRLPTFRRVYAINAHKVVRRRSVQFYVADPPRHRKRRPRRRRPKRQHR